MSSAHFTFSIYLLTFALFLQTIFGANPLFHFCSSSKNFTTNDPYETNLKKLLGNLYYQTPSQGFGLGSVGSYPYQTYGLALCRGDVAATDCKTCVNEASNEIHKRCPYNKECVGMMGEVWDLLHVVNYGKQCSGGQSQIAIRSMRMNLVMQLRSNDSLWTAELENRAHASHSAAFRGFSQPFPVSLTCGL
ncbi:cysteine-rich repeat secretory protein 38-like [Fagus crenata]